MSKPLTLTDPIIAETTASGHDAPLVDYLQEHGASLADVLALYAGSPPDFTDGIRQSALALYLKLTESTDRHKQVAKLWHPSPPNLPHEVARNIAPTWPDGSRWVLGESSVCTGVFDHIHSSIIMPCPCDWKPLPTSWRAAYEGPTLKNISAVALDRRRFRWGRFEQSFWFGECSKCHNLYWACSPSPIMIHRLKYRVLALFRDANIGAILQLHIAAGPSGASPTRSMVSP